MKHNHYLTPEISFYIKLQKLKNQKRPNKDMTTFQSRCHGNY